MARLPPIGSIVEIETPSGFSYAQYVYEHTVPPGFGSLIRVLPGLHRTALRAPPEARGDEADLLVAFYPLSIWLRRGLVTRLTGTVVEPPDRSYTFKLGDMGDGDRWALWDAEEGERFVGTLTADELARYPSLVVFDELALVAEIMEQSGQPDFAASENWYRERSRLRD